MTKYFRITSNVVYSIGVACVLILVAISLFGSEELANPTAMVSMKYSAWVCLAVGMTPMIISTVAFYAFNNFKNSKHKVKKFMLIFLPSFICLGFFVFFAGGAVLHLLTR